MRNKFIKVVFDKGVWNDNIYLCIADNNVKDKDIVIVEKNKSGKMLGICVADDLDVTAINSSYVDLPIKRAFFICESTHDLGSSRNHVLKSLLLVNDTSISELVKIYESVKSNEKIAL